MNLGMDQNMQFYRGVGVLYGLIWALGLATARLGNILNERMTYDYH